ncbi:MAG: NAD(P)-dependent oxidoreductase [Alphaproteobacteria bacterium]
MTKPLILLDPHPRTQAMVYTPETAAALAQLGEVVSHFDGRAADELVDSLLDRVAIIIGQTAMPRERLQRARNLKAIVNVKANWEPNIDYAYAQAQGIHVLSAAPCMAPAVAEACIGFAINLGRGITRADRAFRQGHEAYGIAGSNTDYSLFDASVGLIGFGNLGRALVPLLKPFACRIQAHDPWLSDGYLRQHGAAPASLEDLLEHNQYIFILAGVTAQNTGFLDRKRLMTITQDAAVILCSRAEVVDFDAFLELGQAGRFRAMVDVFPEEPVAGNAPFREFDNIVFSAHRAGALQASYARIRDWMVDDITQILAGYPPMRLQRAEPALAIAMRSR